MQSFIPERPTVRCKGTLNCVTQNYYNCDNVDFVTSHLVSIVILFLLGFHKIMMFHCEIISAACPFKQPRMYNFYRKTDKKFSFFYISIEIIPRKDSFELQKKANFPWLIKMYKLKKNIYIFECNMHFKKKLTSFHNFYFFKFK